MTTTSGSQDKIERHCLCSVGTISGCTLRHLLQCIALFTVLSCKPGASVYCRVSHRVSHQFSAQRWDYERSSLSPSCHLWTTWEISFFHSLTRALWFAALKHSWSYWVEPWRAFPVAFKRTPQGLLLPLVVHPWACCDMKLLDAGGAKHLAVSMEALPLWSTCCHW